MFRTVVLAIILGVVGGCALFGNSVPSDVNSTLQRAMIKERATLLTLDGILDNPERITGTTKADLMKAFDKIHRDLTVFRDWLIEEREDSRVLAAIEVRIAMWQDLAKFFVFGYTDAETTSLSYVDDPIVSVQDRERLQDFMFGPSGLTVFILETENWIQDQGVE